MKTVILAGGKGVRLKELTEELPKPLVEVGGKPILWHIMKIYSHYGFNDFILCGGYKAEKIEEYFRGIDEKWKIKCVDTGEKANKAERLKQIENLIEGDTFFCTYGDGVAKIDIKDLLSTHRRQGKVATMTCVSPPYQFGIVDIDENGLIAEFREKPPGNHWVNGGFFVFNKAIFNYINEGDDLEKEVFEKLAFHKEIYGFKLNNFWQCMDTYKDTLALNEAWENSQAPWKLWD